MFGGRSWSRLAAALFFVWAAFSGVLDPVPASAAGPTNLGVTSFGRILVDPATSHIFVSSPSSSEVIVLDFNGNIVKTITGEAGAYGMALNGSTLYVALSTAGSIDRIDTGTLTESSVLVTGIVHPTDLVYAGSKLWTTTGNCASGWSVQLVSVDPAATTPSVVTQAGAFTNTNSLTYCAAFASNPTANPNLLLAWDLGLSPATITTFDVSAGSAVQQQSLYEGALGNLQDVAINPDGTHFVTASGSPYEFDEWNLSNLGQDGVVYPGNAYPTAIATSAANGGELAGGINGMYDKDFYAYQVGQPATSLATVDFGGTNNTVPSRGVAISPDGSTAFAVSGSTGSAMLLNYVPIAPPPPPGSPGAPTAVSASPGISSATVSWTAPTNQGTSAITGYTVKSSPGGITATSATTSVTVSGLTAGTSYTFYVAATNTAGTGASSAPSNAVVPWCCTAPTNVTATPGDSAALVSWQPPAGAPSVTSSVITPYIGGAAQPTTTIAGAATSGPVYGLTNGTTYTFTVVVNTMGGPSQPSAASNAVTPIQGGTYHPLTPARILDTRSGIGSPASPMRNAETRAIQITGQGGVPATGVSAVVINVTVTGPTAPGYLTVYPTGYRQPTASNLNFVAGQTVPNLVEVAVGSGGQVSLFAQFSSTSGTANAIFDVAGWVGGATNSNTKDGFYNPVTPARIMDTRTGTGVRQGAVGPQQTVTLTVLGVGGVPASGVSAVVLNVTVTSPTAASYLTVYPSDATRPTASNLNFVGGQTVPNRVIVKLSAAGQITFFNAAGSTHVIADVGGWFTDATSTVGGARFSGVVPKRLLDSRTPGIGPLYAPNIYLFQLVDASNNPVTGVSAVVMNVTVTNPSAPSYLTLWPDGPALPSVSDLNYVAGQTVPNLVVVKLGNNATIDLYNAQGHTDVIMDLVGYYGVNVPAPAHIMRLPFGLHFRPLARR